MTRPPRPPLPVESFGPELFNALIEGAKKKFEIQLPYRKAVTFRMRINQLRESMRRLNHPQYTAVSQCRVFITWPDGTPEKRNSRNVRHPTDPNTLCTVALQPSDSEFADVLKQAGVDGAKLKPDDTTEEPDILSSYLEKN